MTRRTWLIVRFVLTSILFVLVGLVSIYVIYNEPLPVGKQGPEAEALAHKMLNALNFEAYKETRYLEWSFKKGKHRYNWDKNLGRVWVQWDGYKIHLWLKNKKQSKVYKNDHELKGTDRIALIDKALALFNNDSFWLVAPYKLFDKGITRSIVLQDDGSEALLVSYKNKGMVDGDTYLWKLRPNGFPISYQMWVGILPIGGLEATWDDWQIVESGAFLPKSHEIGPLKIKMGQVHGYANQ